MGSVRSSFWSKIVCSGCLASPFHPHPPLKLSSRPFRRMQRRSGHSRMYPQMQYPMPMMQVMPMQQQVMPMQQAAPVQGGEESDGEPDPTQLHKIDHHRL